MNYYEVLGVKKSASQDEIKIAYKNLVKKYHPDVYKGNKEFAENMTKEINEAYSTLSNETSRAEYDEEISPKQATYTYTPPPQNPSNSKYSYDNYKRTSSFGNSYDYYRRYRTVSNNSQNNTYSEVNKMHEEFSNNVLNSFGKLSLSGKGFILACILIIYISLIIGTSIQLKSVMKGDSKGTVITQSSTKNSNITTSVPENKIPKDYTNDNESDEFDINDYYSDEQLMKIYEAYYTDYYDSFYEFKVALSEYLSTNYNF
jgi:curved DNA-binding protein CbpA